MGVENEQRRAAPDLEREAWTIAAHTLQREVEELRRELREAQQAQAVAEAERDNLITRLREPSGYGDLLRLYNKTAEEAEQYLDYLRATHQLQSFGYWKQRRKELQLQSA